MYRGLVVDDQDPSKKGRCKIRIMGIYDNIPDEALPWALYSDPFMGGQVGFGGFIVPDIGSMVWCFFENGDHMQPVYFAGAPSALDIPPEAESSSHEDNRGDVSYPRSKVLRTKAGHVIEIDDTEGNARITIIHKSGTQITYHENGDVYEHVVGNYVRTIDGDFEETITGAITRNFDGDLTDTIGGNYTLDVGGNATENVGGTKTLSASGNVVIQGATIQLN
jgi:uncharacterized protein involved in type VI secretion and phage assembly